MKNCTECNEHVVLPDPDPDDWFNDDDVKVVCNITKRAITVACRPYRIEDECEIPEWCPKKNNSDIQTQ